MRADMRSFGVPVALAYRAGRSHAALVMTLMIISIVTGTTFALWLKLLVDALQKGSTADPQFAIGLVGLGLAYFVTLFVSGLALKLAARLQGSVEHCIENDLIRFSFRIKRFQTLESPELSVVLDNLRNGRPFLARGFVAIVQTFGALLRLAVIVGLLLTIHWTLIALPLLAIPSVLLSRRASKMSIQADGHRRQATNVIRKLATVGFSTGGIKATRHRGVRPNLAGFIGREWSRAVAGTAPYLRKATWLSILAWLIYAVVYAVSLLAVGHFGVTGTASAGDVLVLTLLVMLVRDQVGGMMGMLPQLWKVGAISADYTTVRSLAVSEDTSTVRHTATDPLGANGTNGSLAFHEVGYTYGGDRLALTGLDFVVPRGTVVCLTGENGAGKSTLVKLLCRLYDPTAGTISFDGRDLRTIDSAYLNHHQAVMFQDFTRPELQAADAIGIGELSSLEQRSLVMEATERASVGDVISGFPLGFETILGRSNPNGHIPSAGQWQAVAVARALMRRQPRILVLDEPTHSIDPVREAALLDRFIELGRQLAAECGTITFLISHRMATAARADWVMHLHEGRLAGLGPHVELVASAAGYRELFELQRRLYEPEVQHGG